MAMTRQIQDARRKIMNLEREVESVRALPPISANSSFSLGGGNVLSGTAKKPLSRVGRAVLAGRDNDGFGTPVGRENGVFGREKRGLVGGRAERVKEKEVEDKENGGEGGEQEVRRGGGGISFVVDV